MKKRRKKKPQGKNIMSASAMQGGHNKLLSLTCKVLTSTQPSCLHNLICVKPHSTCCSSLEIILITNQWSFLSIVIALTRESSSSLICQFHPSLSTFDSPHLPHILTRMEDKRENYLSCSVLCCVRQLYTMVCKCICAVVKDECWLRFSFCAFV